MPFGYKTIEIWLLKRRESEGLPDSIRLWCVYVCALITLIILISKPSPSLFKWIQICVMSRKTFTIHPSSISDLFCYFYNKNNSTNVRARTLFKVVHLLRIKSSKMLLFRKFGIYTHVWLKNGRLNTKCHVRVHVIRKLWEKKINFICRASLSGHNRNNNNHNTNSRNGLNLLL